MRMVAGQSINVTWRFIRTLLAGGMALALVGCTGLYQQQVPDSSGLQSAGLAVSVQVSTSKAPLWLQQAVEEEYPQTVSLRHYLHQHPELGNQEYATQAYIADFLRAQGIEVVKGTAHAPTAVIGILNPGKGNAIGLRADIDALPIKENTGLDYASKAKGMFFGKEADVSHMCGHDAHMAMLLSAARIMAQHREAIPRSVIFVFQPAEEGDSLENPYDRAVPKLSGARALVEDGVLERYGIKQMFGIHVMARQPAGKLLIASGPALNSVDAFRIRINGRQAHGAMPWSGVDATLTAAALVQNLQQIVSRNIDLTRGMGVITVGRLQAGSTSNVMAGSAELEGTIRSNDPEIRKVLLRRIPEVAEHTALAAGANAQTRILEIYPVTINDPGLAGSLVGALQSFGLEAEQSDWNPGASEDFSFFAQQVPSVFMFLGVDAPGAVNTANNHSDKFVISDEALKAGVSAHLCAALGQW